MALKRYVHNIARSDVCIVKSYILNETIGLVTKCMADVYEPLHRKIWTEEDAVKIVQ